jgi:hypothetical protein
VKIDIDGSEYEYDPDALTLAEAFELKDQTGWGLAAFAQAIDYREPAAFAFIAYFARSRAGEKVDWRKSVVDIGTLIDSIVTATTPATSEDESEEPPDPT